jgi:pilus assembly protein CpaB
VLRRTQKLKLQPDDEVDALSDEQPVLPQRPSVGDDNAPLLLDRRDDSDRRSGGDRRSQDQVRTEFQRTLAMAQDHHLIPSVKPGLSNGTKLRIALVVLAVIAGGAAAWLATQHGPAPVAEIAVQPAAKAPPIPTVKVLVAARAIGLGERLSSGAVSWQDWPQSAVQPGFITDANTPDAPTAMAADVARDEFVVGEPILPGKIVKSDNGYLSAVLATGMRGVSVNVTADAASGGFIVPNDHVDVVLTRSSDADGQHTRTILTNVRVLAINTRLGQSGATGGTTDESNPQSQVFTNAAIATLELNPTQSEIIVSAAAAGKLSLVLRSITDSRADSNAQEEAANQEIRMTSPFWTK